MTPRRADLSDVRAALAVELGHELRTLTPDSFMALIGRRVRELNQAFHVPGSQAELVEAGVLRNSYPAFLLLQRHDADSASRWVVHTWQDYTRLPELGDRQTLHDYDQAVHEFLASDEQAATGRRILSRLMNSFEIGQDEAGRMFGVSGETIRRWNRGKVRIPNARMAALVAAEAALERLEALFLPERLPQVVRRSAALFDGERALDLILRGRIADAAARYEAALAYQS